jgi:hypothetical protein
MKLINLQNHSTTILKTNVRLKSFAFSKHRLRQLKPIIRSNVKPDINLYMTTHMKLDLITFRSYVSGTTSELNNHIIRSKYSRNYNSLIILNVKL